jgi:hypothetical protein
MFCLEASKIRNRKTILEEAKIHQGCNSSRRKRRERFRAVQLREFLVFWINNNDLGTESQYVLVNQLEEGKYAKTVCFPFCHVWVEALRRAYTQSTALYKIMCFAIKRTVKLGFKFENTAQGRVVINL